MAMKLYIIELPNQYFPYMKYLKIYIMHHDWLHEESYPLGYVHYLATCISTIYCMYLKLQHADNILEFILISNYNVNDNTRQHRRSRNVIEMVFRSLGAKHWVLYLIINCTRVP